jgi:hypothetical protein
MEGTFSKLPMLAISRAVRKPRPGQICFRLFEGRLALSSGYGARAHRRQHIPCRQCLNELFSLPNRGSEFSASSEGFSDQPVLSPCLDRVI